MIHKIEASMFRTHRAIKLYSQISYSCSDNNNQWELDTPRFQFQSSVLGCLLLWIYSDWMPLTQGHSTLQNILQSFWEEEAAANNQTIGQNEKNCQTVLRKSVNALKGTTFTEDIHIPEASVGNSSAASLALTSLDILPAPPVPAVPGQWVILVPYHYLLLLFVNPHFLSTQVLTSCVLPTLILLWWYYSRHIASFHAPWSKQACKAVCIICNLYSEYSTLESPFFRYQE